MPFRHQTKHDEKFFIYLPTFQVREEECQVECSQVAGLTLPRPEEVEEVVTWCGLVLAGAGRQGGGGEVRVSYWRMTCH